MPLHTIVRPFLHRAGFDFIRYDADRFHELRRPPLLQSRRIDLVLDVGANEGQYAADLLETGYRGRIVSFEPLESAYRRLQRRAAPVPGWETRQLALGETPAFASLHVARNLASSSLLPMADRHVASAPESAYVADEQVEVRKLDDMAPEIVRPKERIWLKLDVQGFELPVLLGAERTLDQVEVVETELSLLELYEGQALLGDVVSHLTACGFGAWFFDTVFRDPASGELLQLDGIFARRR